MTHIEEQQKSKENWETYALKRKIKTKNCFLNNNNNNNESLMKETLILLKCYMKIRV